MFSMSKISAFVLITMCLLASPLFASETMPVSIDIEYVANGPSDIQAMIAVTNLTNETVTFEAELPYQANFIFSNVKDGSLFALKCNKTVPPMPIRPLEKLYLIKSVGAPVAANGLDNEAIKPKSGAYLTWVNIQYSLDGQTFENSLTKLVNVPAAVPSKGKLEQVDRRLNKIETMLRKLSLRR